MTPGARLVQEWDAPAAVLLRKLGALIREQDHAAIDVVAREWEERLRDLARRIDAALAECESRQRWNFDDRGEIVTLCRGEHEKHEGCRELRFVPEAKLAEREAQIAALVVVFENAKLYCTRWAVFIPPGPWDSNWKEHGHCLPTQHIRMVAVTDEVITNTAPAARAFVERIREECAQVAERLWGECDATGKTIAAAIRAMK